MNRRQLVVHGTRFALAAGGVGTLGVALIGEAKNPGGKGNHKQKTPKKLPRHMSDKKGPALRVAVKGKDKLIPARYVMEEDRKILSHLSPFQEFASEEALAKRLAEQLELGIIFNAEDAPPVSASSNAPAAMKMRKGAKNQ